MPGATVTAVQVQTQAARTTVTDASGFYTFANLAPGRYNITAELQGFKKAVRESVQLDATGALMIDFSLATGALTEEVTVTAESTLIQSDAALRKTIEAKDIEQLSFQGRNPIGVAALKAGVIGGSFNNVRFESLTNGSFNINGSRTDENNITVDGATAIRTPFERRDHRRPERGHDPGSASADRRLHAGVRTRERRSNPIHHQERQQQVQRQCSGITCAMTSCRRTPGRATAAPTRSRTAVRRRSISSSTRTRWAVRFPSGS